MNEIDSRLARIEELEQNVKDRREGVKSAHKDLVAAEDELADATAVLYMVEVVNPVDREYRMTTKVVAISEYVQRRVGMFVIRLDPPRHDAVYLEYVEDLDGRKYRIFWPVGQELNFTERDVEEVVRGGREHRACLFRTRDEAQAFMEKVRGLRGLLP